MTQLLGEFDDQNGVLAGQTHQHDQSDLAVNIILQPARPLRAQRSQHGHGDGK